MLAREDQLIDRLDRRCCGRRDRGWRYACIPAWSPCASCIARGARAPPCGVLVGGDGAPLFAFASSMSSCPRRASSPRYPRRFRSMSMSSGKSGTMCMRCSRSVRVSREVHADGGRGRVDQGDGVAHARERRQERRNDLDGFVQVTRQGGRAPRARSGARPPSSRSRSPAFRSRAPSGRRPRPRRRRASRRAG